MDFYYNSLCHVCKQFQNNLKRCAACKSIAYCSKEHQSGDWKNHKEMCKVLADSTKFVKLDPNCGYDKWRSYRTYLQFYLEQRLGRELRPYESQMWMFPRNCTVCYSSENLRDCQNCACTVYCSEEHQKRDENHKLICDQLKLCRELDCFYSTNPNVPVSFRDIPDEIQKLPNDTKQFVQQFIDASNVENELENIFVRDIFATLLTVLYGLEKCGVLLNREIAQGTLIVHLVGADISELSLHWKTMIKLLKLWIKNLTVCKFFLIGPDCESSMTQNIEFCDEVQIEIIPGFYHNICEEIDKPTIVVALNSGLHEFESNEAEDTWSKCLSILVNNNAPLLLTAYTEEELKEDLERLSALSPKTIMELQRNPFSNSRPIRDWDSEFNYPFYVNAYIAIISGNKYCGI